MIPGAYKEPQKTSVKSENCEFNLFLDHFFSLSCFYFIFLKKKIKMKFGAIKKTIKKKEGKNPNLCFALWLFCIHFVP